VGKSGAGGGCISAHGSVSGEVEWNIGNIGCSWLPGAWKKWPRMDTKKTKLGRGKEKNKNQPRMAYHVIGVSTRTCFKDVAPFASRSEKGKKGGGCHGGRTAYSVLEANQGHTMPDADRILN